ncbi:hypothetical protein TNCV_2091361 [Trichonephila clavipes]|nr:hypothetical protein TNCV_2091361 [Trichonephila clavipes]
MRETHRYNVDTMSPVLTLSHLACHIRTGFKLTYWMAGYSLRFSVGTGKPKEPVRNVISQYIIQMLVTFEDDAYVSYSSLQCFPLISTPS